MIRVTYQSRHHLERMEQKRDNRNFFMFFLAKHKTSQRLTHIFSFIQTISSLSRLVSSKLTGDFVWVHRYKLHLPRNFNSCSGLIINNCSFFSIFDFDGNWLFTAAGSTILFKCVFFSSSIQDYRMSAILIWQMMNTVCEMSTNENLNELRWIAQKILYTHINSM